MAVQTREEQVSLDASRDKAGIFVSYTRDDEAIVERLAAALRGNGRDVWIDIDDIRGTEEWERAIDSGIDSSDAVVFVLSPAFVGSEQCGRELSYAVDKGKRLVPLLAGEVDPADVRPELARLNWIAIGNVDAPALAALEEALDTDLDWVRTHTDLLVRAVAWEVRNEDRGLLLRGQPLADAERFLANAAGKEPPPAPLHTRYVLAGRRAATRRQRGTLAVVTTFLVVAVALAVLALVQRNRAIHESNVASSRELAGASTAVADSDPELARLLAIEAMDREQTPEAVAALRRAVAQPAIRVHTEPKTTVVTLSPDGRRVAVRRPDDTLDVLDVVSGRRVASSLEGTSHTARVAFATGGRWLAATTDEGDVIVWDLARERWQRVEGQVVGLEFSPDGSRLLLVERTGSVAIVNPHSPDQRVTLPANAGESSQFLRATAAFAPRGDLVVTWDEDSPEAQIWDARTGALQSTLRHGASITDAGISPDGSLALTAGRDMTVRFWSSRTGAEAGRPVITVPPADSDSFDADIAAASFSPQSSAVVTTLTQDRLQVWRTRDAKLRLSLRNRFDYLTDQGFGPAAPYLLTGSSIHDWVHDRKVLEPPMRVSLVHADGSFESVERLGDQSTRVWSGVTESTLIDLARAASDVSSAGGRIAIGYADGTAEVRDARGGRALLRVPRSGLGPAAVELSSDGRTLAVSRVVDANGRRGVELWRIGRSERRSLDASVTDAVSFSADAERLLVFTNTGAGAFAVIDIKTGDTIGETFRPRTVLIESTALSPDGELFVQPTADNSIDVYRVADGRRFGVPLRGQHAADVAVSPDNKLLASGGDGVIIWDLESGRQMVTLSAHKAAVTRVAFSPDSRLLLTRSTDGTLRVWEARTGAPVAAWSDLPTGLERPAELDAPTVLDLGLDFSTSGEELLRADDGFVYSIPCPACAEPDELLARAKMDTRRPLSRAQRRQYLHEGE